MAEQPEFDPRFDPAFQRGYKPPARPQRTPPAPNLRDAVDQASSDFTPPPNCEKQQIVEPPSATEPPQAEQQPTELQPTQEPQRDTPVNTALVSTSAVRRGVNPYIAILWVVGVIFFLGGAALLFVGYLKALTVYVAGPAASASAQGLYVLGTIFGGPLITVGLATIAGLIFFSAWHSWRRRDGSNS